MRLHENKQLSKDIIDLTAFKENISIEVVEKYYYVYLDIKAINMLNYSLMQEDKLWEND